MLTKDKRFEVSSDEKGLHFWLLRGGDGKIIAKCPRGYRSRTEMYKVIQQIRNTKTTKVVQVKHSGKNFGYT